MVSKVLQLFRKLVLFSTSSLLGTIVDMLVLWICSHYILRAGYVNEYIISPSISFEMACLANFTIAYFVIWKDRVSHFSTKSYWKHFAAYNTTSFSAFLVKLMFMQAIHFIFPGMNVLICNLLALCVSGGVNFALNEWVIFRKKKPADADKSLLDTESLLGKDSLEECGRMIMDNPGVDEKL